MIRAAIPSCGVVVEDVSTGVCWNHGTDELGSCRLKNLPVGDYMISAQSEGFTPEMLSGIAVALNHATTANVTLEIAPQVENTFRGDPKVDTPNGSKYLSTMIRPR